MRGFFTERIRISGSQGKSPAYPRFFGLSGQLAGDLEYITLLMR
jgi:hypothetical protein